MDNMDNETREIVEFCVKGYECPPTPTMTTMRNVCDEFKRKNVKVFEDMFTSLDISEANGHSTFLGVINELFSEGITWSRIMALLTFSSLFASECAVKELHSMRDEVPDWTMKYFEDHLLSWINDHGGWDGFREHFTNEEHKDQSVNLKTILCGVAAGALGAFTIGAFLASKT